MPESTYKTTSDFPPFSHLRDLQNLDRGDTEKTENRRFIFPEL